MNKNFDEWNEVKKRTNVEEPRLYTVREIWWCRLGVNVGSEQDGGATRANISQIRTIDTRRLVEKVGFLDERLFRELKKRAKALL